MEGGGGKSWRDCGGTRMKMKIGVERAAACVGWNARDK